MATINQNVFNIPKSRIGSYNEACIRHTSDIRHQGSNKRPSGAFCHAVGQWSHTFVEVATRWLHF